MREFIDGNTAIARGALAAGCDFFAGYPITPATPILLTMMRELPKTDGVAVQGEDEIASLGFCIGAALTGRRAFTATSGPGISLYSENIGLAIMGEVPLVIVDVQRMGPATGGATTAAQGDLQFIRWCTSGGYPVLVLCPASVADCYTLTMRAFDLAERFRCPAFVLTDKEVASTMDTVNVSEFVPIAVRERPVADAECLFQPCDYPQPDGNRCRLECRGGIGLFGRPPPEHLAAESQPRHEHHRRQQAIGGDGGDPPGERAVARVSRRGVFSAAALGATRRPLLFSCSHRSGASPRTRSACRHCLPAP